MADEKELLQAVLDHPDDDAPRLAYAEWCDRRGNPPPDPRGEFIRIQIEIAKKKGRLADPQCLNLTNQASSLLWRNKAAWGKSIKDFSRDFDFVRGFVEYLEMSAREFVRYSRDIFQRVPIRHLCLTDSKSFINDIFSMPDLVKIRSISLPESNISNDDVRLIAKSINASELRWISLVGNNISFVGAEAVAASNNLKKLKWLDLRSNPCDPRDAPQFDQGVRVSAPWLPSEGLALEEKYGYIPWLHIDAKSENDLVPDPYYI